MPTPTAPDWQPDPNGRHQHRYWDGSSWTEHVSDDGVVSIDPFTDSGADGVDEIVDDAVEDEGAAEEESANGLKLKKFVITHTNYLGGHPLREKKQDGGVLRFDAEGVHMRGLRELFVIPWSDVTELAVEGSEEVERRVTASRLVLLGVFAFAAKKKGPKSAFVTVATTDGEAIFECTKTGPHAIKAKLTTAISWVQEHNAPRPMVSPVIGVQSDVMDQIKRLSELRTAGALTEEEFKEKKAELLRRL